MSHFLVYWKPDTVRRYNSNNDTVHHTASNQYDRVKLDDMLWIVTSTSPGKLLLLGRQKADRFLNKTQAIRYFDKPDIWDSKFHILANDAEEIVNLDISDIAKDLRFKGKVESLPSEFTGQHLQTMRELKPSAIRLLENVWHHRFDSV